MKYTSRDKIKTLAELYAAQAALTLDIHEAVAQARREGATWDAIGSQLHITRQAAQQKYGTYVARHEHNGDPSPEMLAVEATLTDEDITHPGLVTASIFLEADTPDKLAAVELENGIAASDITESFYAKASSIGLAPEVDYNPDTGCLRVTVTSQRPYGGWVALYQWPGASSNGRKRHYWDYASMNANAPKKVDAYTARKAIERFK